MLGGGMRQAGILAAAGIVALETMTGRLVEDHTRAKKLAAGLRQIPGLHLDPQVPATNMVFLALTPEVRSTPEEMTEKLKREGILAGVTGSRTFRLVLHYWIDDPGVEKTIAAFQQALQ